MSSATVALLPPPRFCLWTDRSAAVGTGDCRAMLDTGRCHCHCQQAVYSSMDSSTDCGLRGREGDSSDGHGTARYGPVTVERPGRRTSLPSLAADLGSAVAFLVPPPAYGAKLCTLSLLWAAILTPPSWCIWECFAVPPNAAEARVFCTARIPGAGTRDACQVDNIHTLGQGCSPRTTVVGPE